MKSVSARVSGVKTLGVRAAVAAALSLLGLPLVASAQDGIEHCDKPMGALAVVEPQDYVSQSLSRYGLQSPTGLIRMMVQQSNCFIVVERGIGMQNMMQERALQESGELRQGSNMGGGQMVSADFVLTPAVVFSENDSGGIGGALGGLLPGSKGRALGAVAGGLKFKEAQTSMLVTDARSGVQVASAEGNSKKADLNLGGALFGSSAAGALGGYTKTNEGKVIAASLADNYNNIVRSVRSQPSLQRDVGTLAEEAAQEDQGRRRVQRRRHHRAEARQPQGVLVAERIREGGRDSVEGRRDDLHGRGEGRLPEDRIQQRRRLGEEGLVTR